ncbi:MAG TPA: DUF975 family protein, partial [Ruminiclostridium sp.]
INYWKAFLISLVIVIAGGYSRSGGSSVIRGGRGGYNSGSNDWIVPNTVSDRFLLLSILVIAIIVIAVFIFAISFRIFLGYSLEVGGRRYFIKSAQHDDNRSCFSFAFLGENYKGIVLTMLLKGVQNFLWYLLLIIPGIVKSYSYRMVPYILADNPNIGYKRAIALSENMTDGHKFDIFVLDLSFIGWYLLGLLALVVGTLFLMPYENATNAELYLSLRESAISIGFTSQEELLLSRGTDSLYGK